MKLTNVIAFLCQWSIYGFSLILPLPTRPPLYVFIFLQDLENIYFFTKYILQICSGSRDPNLNKWYTEILNWALKSKFEPFKKLWLKLTPPHETHPRDAMTIQHMQSINVIYHINRIKGQKTYDDFNWYLKSIL